MVVSLAAAVVISFVAVTMNDAAINTCAIQKGKCFKDKFVVCTDATNLIQPSAVGGENPPDGVKLCDDRSLIPLGMSMAKEATPEGISCAVKCPDKEKDYAICVKVTDGGKQFFFPMKWEKKKVADALFAAIETRLGLDEPKKEAICH